jgi:pimeloyl-ACP methyl ester carboxylesterase
MPFVSLQNAKIYYQVDDFTDPWKPVETVLLHHAAAGNVDRWRAWVPTLARSYRVLRMDARGHGRSSTPPVDHRWSIESLARDVHDVVTQLKIGPIHYVGASAGGIIGIRFAHDSPELVRSLTLIASTPQMSRTRVDFNEWLNRIRHLGVRGFFSSDARTRFSPEVDPGLIDWFADEAAKTPESVITAFIPYMASVDLTDILPKIQVPVLILAGERDEITPLEAQHTLKARLPNSRLILYPTSGHNIAEEFADKCAEDTLRFLRGVSADQESQPRQRPNRQADEKEAAKDSKDNPI